MSDEQLLLPGDFDGDLLVEEPEDGQDERYLKIGRSLSPKFDDELTKRSHMATWNFLMRYGLPKHPAELRAIFEQTPIICLIWAADKGYISFNESAIATEEERMQDEQELPTELEEDDSQDAMVIQGRFGQYL